MKGCLKALKSIYSFSYIIQIKPDHQRATYWDQSIGASRRTGLPELSLSPCTGLHQGASRMGVGVWSAELTISTYCRTDGRHNVLHITEYLTGKDPKLPKKAVCLQPILFQFFLQLQAAFKFHPLPAYNKHAALRACICRC